VVFSGSGKDVFAIKWLVDFKMLSNAFPNHSLILTCPQNNDEKLFVKVLGFPPKFFIKAGFYDANCCDYTHHLLHYRYTSCDL